MNNNIETILQALLAGEPVSNSEHVVLKDAVKPLFFGKGFMTWARNEKRDEIKENIISEGNNLIYDTKPDANALIDSFASMASELNQGGQLNLFYDLYKIFPKFQGESLKAKDAKLLSIIKGALQSEDKDAKARATMLIALYAESSNSQSRKSSAGNAAEQAIELLMRSIGLVKGETYGTQFIYQGSNTDFVVPYAESGDINSVSAFIAVQVSTNDRARLSSSELHRGAKRYLCSLNGCNASSKSTKDIGDDLAAGYLDNETHYVVIERERLAAIEDAQRRLEKAEGTPRAVNAKRRLKWLNAYAINYEEFARQIKQLASE
jgi:hypothetical protein